MIRLADKVEIGDFPLLLAPMEDVSDPPFRAICKRQGADIVYSEFISSEGLIREAEKSLQKLDIYDEERPVGIQLFGSEPDVMKESAIVATAARPDLIDINFGCPVKKVVCKGAGAGLLKDIPRMIKIVEAVVQSTHLPVTVKTRLGWDQNDINIIEVSERLQDAGIQALTIHARTRTQMYKGKSDWSWIEKVKNNPRIFIPIFGNGDIDAPEKAIEYKNRYGADGIMIGRASIGNPWIFSQIKSALKGELPVYPGLRDKVDCVREHLKRSVKWKGEKTGVFEMRRHYATYFKSLDNFKPFKSALVIAGGAEEVLCILDEIERNYYTETIIG